MFSGFRVAQAGSGLYTEPIGDGLTMGARKRDGEDARGNEQAGGLPR